MWLPCPILRKYNYKIIFLVNHCKTETSLCQSFLVSKTSSLEELYSELFHGYITAWPNEGGLTLLVPQFVLIIVSKTSWATKMFINNKIIISRGGIAILWNTLKIPNKMESVSRNWHPRCSKPYYKGQWKQIKVHVSLSLSRPTSPGKNRTTPCICVWTQKHGERMEWDIFQCLMESKVVVVVFLGRKAKEGRPLTILFFIWVFYKDIMVLHGLCS